MHEYKSTETNEIFSALSKAQAEMETAGTDANNPFYKNKYAKLPEIIKASRPSLAKYNLSVTQHIMAEDTNYILVSVLGHSSGQWLASYAPINPVKNDPQSFGSAVTYMRRYSYVALVGVVIAEEDDDGNAASKGPAKITAQMASKLQADFKNYKEEEKNLLATLAIPSWTELPADKFTVVQNVLSHVKQ